MKNIRWDLKHSQNILPLVFDDSMSYYENVCKLVYIVNQLIEIVNGELSESVKAYIDEQFNNIMLDAIYDPEAETISFTADNKN